MGSNSLTQNPFAVLTFIVAPAILTNATSVLAMSTINRMLRTRDRMHQLYEQSKSGGANDSIFLEQVQRVERQALFLLTALRWIYVSLGAFAAAALVTLVGALAGQIANESVVHAVVIAGLLLGLTGVTGLVGGCIHLFRATQLSVMNIREEAARIREGQKHLSSSTQDPDSRRANLK